MKIYLVQHGEAMSKEEDPDRPLTDVGRTDVQAVGARLAAASEVPVDRIVHSGKTRAKETAAELSVLLDAGPVEASDDLGPTDDPTVWAERLEEAAGELDGGGIMLVGHLPYMEKMAAHLVRGAVDRPVLRFRKGGVVCLEKDDDAEGGWAVAWFLPPALA